MRLKQVQLGYFAIFAVAAFLLLPALHYSLDSLIGLVERRPYLAHIFIDPREFLYYLQTRFTFTDPERLEWFLRFTPFMEVWNGLIWFFWGEVGYFHHLNRWLFAFGTAAFFIAAYRRFSRVSLAANAPHQTDRSILHVIPVALLAYVWLFFPNPTFTLIESFELYTAFFLGVCNYAAALMLTTAQREGASKAHALFCLGFLGLLLSKETNVALAFGLLVFYWALAAAQGLSAKKLLAAMALTAALSVVLWRITIAVEMAELKDMYYLPSSPIIDRLSANAPIILKGLFQYEVSAAITAAFALLLLALAVAAIVGIRRRRIDGELAFILLLLGEFASMFLALSVSHEVQPRYWSVLIPLLVSLLAFSAKFLLDIANRNKAFANCTALALTIFVGFFVGANYHNFLYQFAISHSARNLDDSVISEVAGLLNNGQYVQANPADWEVEQIGSFNGPYNHQTLWPDSPYGNDSIHRVPPSDPEQPYYILDLMGKPCTDGDHSVHADLIGRADYSLLDYAAKLSGFLQGKTPHTSIDGHPGLAPLGEYRWVIYAMSNGMNDRTPCLRKLCYSGRGRGIHSIPNEPARPCPAW